MDPTTHEDTGHVDSDTAIVAAVGALISEIRTWREAIERSLTFHQGRSRRWYLVAVVLGIYVAAMTTGLVLLSVNSAHQRQEIHSAVTPGQPIYERGQRQQAVAIQSLVSEMDCRTRAAIAHLPPMRPDQSCLVEHPELGDKP